MAAYLHFQVCYDTPGLLRALRFLNPVRIRNPLIFLRKMAAYSCGAALESPDALASKLASHRRLSTLGIITHLFHSVHKKSLCNRTDYDIFRRNIRLSFHDIFDLGSLDLI